jgi:multicomponent Na+:H+ antiporter subunit F
VNVWLIAATVLLLSLIPCGLVCFGSTGSPIDRLISFELASVIDTIVFLLLAQGFGRDVYFDLALALALLSLAGALVFSHFMERWV